MNIYKPFVLATHAAGQYNKYVSYSLESCITQFDGQAFIEIKNAISNNKTWCDTNGQTSIIISDILRDNAYIPTPEFKYNTQGWELAGTRGTCKLDDLQPIEYEGDIFNNFLRYKVDGAEVVNYDVEAVKPYLYHNTSMPLNPYTNNTGVIYYNSVGCDTLPHIPYIATDRCFFGFTFGFDRRFNADTITLGNIAGSGDKIETTLSGQYGNYFPLYTLSDLYNTFHSPLEALFLSFQANGVEHVVPIPERVTYIDRTCFYDYYLQWFTPWMGWQSQGVNAKQVRREQAIKRQTYTNVFNQAVEYQTDHQFTLTLQRKCDKPMSYLLRSVAVSPCVWLYDVANDTGRPVICTNTKLQTEPTTQLIDVTIDLQDVQNYTL